MLDQKIYNTATPRDYVLSVLLEDGVFSSYFIKIRPGRYVDDKANEAMGYEQGTDYGDEDILKKWTMEEWRIFRQSAIDEAMKINRAYIEGVVAGLYASWWQLYIENHRHIEVSEFPRGADNEVEELIDLIMEKF